MIEVIDFYSDWCSPCQRIKPILKELESERTDVFFDYINVEQDIELAKANNVFSLPTIIFKKNGEEYNRQTGFISKQKILDIINLG